MPCFEFELREFCSPFRAVLNYSLLAASCSRFRYNHFLIWRTAPARFTRAAFEEVFLGNSRCSQEDRTPWPWLDGPPHGHEPDQGGPLSHRMEPHRFARG